MNNLRFIKILATFAIFLSSTNIFATELKWTHYGARPLGMGNAFVAVSDDYNALFYNPAGLARLKEWDGEFLNPALEISDTTVSFINDLTEVLGGDAGGTAEILDLFQKQSGKVHHASLNLTPHLIFQNFGFGIGIENELTMATHSDIDIQVNLGPRVIAPISFAKNFLNDKLSVGMSVKLLARGGVDGSFNIQTISAFSKSSTDEAEGTGETNEDATKLDDFIQGGVGYGFDVGILYTPIKTMAPTLGISIADVGGSPYQKFDVGGTSIGAPDLRLPAVNTGISIKPIQSGRMYLLLAADAHAINQPLHYTNKLNFGLEWGYGDIIKLQTGLKAGYLTAGLQFDVGLLNLRFATYTVDHAPIIGLHDDLTERRFLLQLKLLI